MKFFLKGTIFILLLIISQNGADKVNQNSDRKQDVQSSNSFDINVSAGYGVGNAALVQAEDFPKNHQLYLPIDQFSNNIIPVKQHESNPNLSPSASPADIVVGSANPNLDQNLHINPEGYEQKSSQDQSDYQVHEQLLEPKTFEDRPSLQELQKVVEDLSDNPKASRIVQILKVPAVYEIHLQSDAEPIQSPVININTDMGYQYKPQETNEIENYPPPPPPPPVPQGSYSNQIITNYEPIPHLGFPASLTHPSIMLHTNEFDHFSTGPLKWMLPELPIPSFHHRHHPPPAENYLHSKKVNMARPIFRKVRHFDRRPHMHHNHPHSNHYMRGNKNKGYLPAPPKHTTHPNAKPPLPPNGHQRPHSLYQHHPIKNNFATHKNEFQHGSNINNDYGDEISINFEPSPNPPNNLGQPSNQQLSHVNPNIGNNIHNDIRNHLNPNFEIPQIDLNQIIIPTITPTQLTYIVPQNNAPDNFNISPGEEKKLDLQSSETQNQSVEWTMQKSQEFNAKEEKPQAIHEVPPPVLVGQGPRHYPQEQQPPAPPVMQKQPMLQHASMVFNRNNYMTLIPSLPYDIKTQSINNLQDPSKNTQVIEHVINFGHDQTASSDASNPNQQVNQEVQQTKNQNNQQNEISKNEMDKPIWVPEPEINEHIQKILGTIGNQNAEIVSNQINPSGSLISNQYEGATIAPLGNFETPQNIFYNEQTNQFYADTSSSNNHNNEKLYSNDVENPVINTNAENLNVANVNNLESKGQIIYGQKIRPVAASTKMMNANNRQVMNNYSRIGKPRPFQRPEQQRQQQHERRRSMRQQRRKDFVDFVIYIREKDLD